MSGDTSETARSHREETQAYKQHLRRRFAQQEDDGGATFRLMMPIIGLVGTFFLVVVATLVANRVYVGASAGTDGYLYRGDPNRSAYVIDFHDPSYQDSETSSSEPLYVDPPFLLEQSTPRIVEFYAPWCGHCQHFAPHYVKVAKQVNEESNQGQHQKVEFHAISVTNYPTIFNHHKDIINGFPNIFAIPPNHNITTSIKLAQVTNATVIDTLFNETLHEEKTADRESKLREEGTQQTNESKDAKKHPIHELLSLTQAHEHHVPPKSGIADDGGHVVVVDDAESTIMKDRYQDAITSLQYMLSQEIYKESSGELDQDKQQTLKDFLILLENTLPVEGSDSHANVKLWTSIHTMIQELLNNFDTKVVSGEDSLVEIVSKYRMKNEEGWKWTSHCMTHKPYPMGYPCGLWQLFHIISVGVAERRPNHETSDTATTHAVLSPQCAANTIRNVVHHFFGCLECSSNFVHHYDSCGLDGCHRLLSYEEIKNKKNDSEEDIWQWRELSLWFWETHNHVNERLRREDLDEDENAADEGATTHDKSPKRHPEVLWPTLAQCPTCWPEQSQISSSYDRWAVYNYLQRSFWRPSRSSSKIIAGTIRSKKQLNETDGNNDRSWALHVLFIIMTLNMIRLLFGYSNKGRRVATGNTNGPFGWVASIFRMEKATPGRRRAQSRQRRKHLKT